MSPEAWEYGAAAGLTVLVVAAVTHILDRVISLTRASKGKGSAQHLEVMQELVKKVDIRNAFNVRLETQEKEIALLRRHVHDLRDQIQKLLLEILNHEKTP